MTVYNPLIYLFLINQLYKIEEISLTNKCNQLLVYDILRESDSVVQESFQNILTVNDDSLLVKLEDRLKILLNVQKILIQEVC